MSKLREICWRMRRKKRSPREKDKKKSSVLLKTGVGVRTRSENDNGARRKTGGWKRSDGSVSRKRVIDRGAMRKSAKERRQSGDGTMKIVNAARGRSARLKTESERSAGGKTKIERDACVTNAIENVKDGVEKRRKKEGWTSKGCTRGGNMRRIARVYARTRSVRGSARSRSASAERRSADARQRPQQRGSPQTTTPLGAGRMALIEARRKASLVQRKRSPP